MRPASSKSCCATPTAMKLDSRTRIPRFKVICIHFMYVLPESHFWGDVLFAIEAVDRSPNANEAMTQWHRFRMATFEQQAIADGTLRFVNLGATFTGAVGTGIIRAQ